VERSLRCRYDSLLFGRKVGREISLDALVAKSGGLSPAQQVPVGPSYQVALARAVKTAVRIPVVAVGLITGFDQAEAIVATREADIVALA
jgi:2,4-dienoyl-CoA reductase-like NADH-dependent reductase (Old Yellow Enzyme family)